MQYNLLTECVYAFVKKQYTKSGLILLFTISTIIIGVVFIGNVAIVDPVEESVVCAASLGGIQSSLELYNTHYKYYPDNLEVLIKEGYLLKKDKR